ncbi:MAG: hypothetical protein H0W48_00045 [Methylibium sp.]|nr:hypothetical protein [Methylibium sp.]
MALFKATQVAAKLPVPSANGATDVIPVVGDFLIPAGLASGDVVEMGAIPAGYVPVDLIVDNAAGGTTVTADFGILSGAYDSTGARTCGAQFAAAQAMQTAGIKRMAAAGGARVAPTTADRGWGFVASTVATPTAGAAVRATLLCRPQSEGV